jgi:hypothetical protein
LFFVFFRLEEKKEKPRKRRRKEVTRKGVTDYNCEPLHFRSGRDHALPREILH